MIRYIFILFLSLVVFSEAIAQKKDTAVYYLSNSGKLVSTKDSADFFLVVLPPDTSVDKNLSVIKEYYKNGKIRLAGSATMQDLKFQGPVITFFANGHKMNIKNYDNGELTGDIIEYYPNGKFYNKKSYIKTVTEETELLLKDCSDSTGKVMAVNGNGSWINFNDGFTRTSEQGIITNGRRDSVWNIVITDTTGFVKTYKDGKIIKSEPCTISDNKFFVNVEQVPEFPGGLDAFLRFLNSHIRYPDAAKKNNTSGRVIVSFVVERDGSLTDVKVARGIGDGCDEEAVRLIKSSPKWKPGIQNGKPVRVLYSIPIAFSLDN
ncbi:MAG TPA: TonB family protein [Mucilaginibacter sp.]|jgi:TonB family protein